VPVFKPPIGVVNNAKKAIKWREEYPNETSSAGTQVGWTRARQLANGESVSEDIIGRMVSFFARHENSKEVAPEYRNEPWRDNGFLMHLAWGGDEGKTWSNKIYNQIQNNKSFSSMSQIEHKHIQLEAKNFDEIKGVIKGYGVTYGNKDRVNDIILQGSLQESIEDYNAGVNVKYLFEHQDSLELNSNIDKFESDNIGTPIQAAVSEFAKNKMPTHFKRIIDGFKSGKAFLSVGFFIKDAYVIRGGQKVYIVKDSQEVGNRLSGETRYLEKIKVREFSFTTNPANMQAKIFDLKSINFPKYSVDIESSWDGTQAEQRWREYTKSVEMPNTNYKNGFLYFDAENQDLFGSYHLQVVDIIDGEPKIIERAVFAVYQAMNGARNGLKVVPENEMPKLQGAVNELYTKINRVRVAEGMEALEMPNFKTKSEFDIALDSIKNRNIPNAKTNFERMLVKMKKEGKLSLSHYEIRKLVDTVVGTVCKAKLPTQEIEKILDNQNNDVNEQKSEPHLPEAHSPDNLIQEVKNQTFADAINAVAKNFKK
jgi:hypothetical protein